MLNKSHSHFTISVIYLLMEVYYLNFEQNLSSAADILLVFPILSITSKTLYCLSHFFYEDESKSSAY